MTPDRLVSHDRERGVSETSAIQFLESQNALLKKKNLPWPCKKCRTISESNRLEVMIN